MSTRIFQRACLRCKFELLRSPVHSRTPINKRLLHTTQIFMAEEPVKPTDPNVQINPANIQLLSKELQQQVFGNTKPRPYDDDDVFRERLSKLHLLSHRLPATATVQEPINLKLPKLCGNSIEEHFIRIGLEQCGDTLEKAERFAQAELPDMPKTWSEKSGWTRYQGDKPEAVDYPMEELLTFDVEVLVKTSNFPVMAVAVSPDAWYSWTSPYLSGDSDSPHHLIPFGRDKERLIVGHNVGYDRARIADEYTIHKSPLKYLDTMSLHIAVSGLGTQQRPMWLKQRNQLSMPLMEEQEEGVSGVPRPKQDALPFFDVSTLNNLKDVVEFHCGIEMDKSVRSYFESGTLKDIQKSFQESMKYCAIDVAMTHNVYSVVFPKFREHCPHPVSFAGILHMGNSFLTVNEKWKQYLDRSASKHLEMTVGIENQMLALAERARALSEEEYSKDPWLSQLDWSIKPRARKLKGMPQWYREAYDSKANKLSITIRSRIAPLLLRLKWQGNPLHYLQTYGWCYKMPLDKVSDDDMKNAVHDDNGYAYFKVPHKDGPEANCGNPLAKSYLNAYEEGVLTSEYETARTALNLNAMSAYWISARERILNQYVVYGEQPDVNIGLDDNYGIILPQMVTMGTITRRAVENTWLTASNAKNNRIGSELKSMIVAPEGYKIVGADVDSEELWISSLMGDAQFGHHGATALGWMTLQGTKAEGTDLHSKTAAILNISRDKAKIFNYSRIYGAGLKHAVSLMRQHNQAITTEEAEQLASKLYKSTKGKRFPTDTNEFLRKFWHGGIESYMFNALESIALSGEPKTPVLGCHITDALKPRYAGDGFLPSRINWVVQSSGVDYLHLLIVSMNHLINRYKINARFMISVHDEVRYLSTEEDQHRTALALQVANIWTRALFSARLSVEGLPQSVAFFSAVDIDHVLRKEPTMTCVTPSHSEKIQEGVSHTLEDTLTELEKATHSSRNNVCLLGPESAQLSHQVDDQAVHDLLDKFKIQTEPTSLRFLYAQAFLDRKIRYKSQPDSHMQSGGRQTVERVVNSLDVPTVNDASSSSKAPERPKSPPVKIPQ
ncbi:DNA polymerase family A-domain-containing protein [Fennellomyces sp. T-0311]|nr:DNA polymerase family A-domain-containing protein [Fennellomyces sp. T-0311]